MATDIEIITYLQGISNFYGEEPPSVDGYLLALDDIPPEILAGTRREVARQCKWFPKPAEVRALALAHIEATKRATPDMLMAGLIEMEDRFYATSDEIDRDLLEKTASYYERAGCPEKAAWVREKAARWESVLDGTAPSGRIYVAGAYAAVVQH